MKEKIISATIEALKSTQQARFFQTERGYHGKFYCELQKQLVASGILSEEMLLEMEYQKSARHDTYQRPDIVLHIPAELHSTSVQNNNFAVWARKHSASPSSALEDFGKLDEMFERLHYPLGFFINVNSTEHHLDHYTGIYKERVHAFAIKLVGNEPSIIHASLVGNEIYLEQI